MKEQFDDKSYHIGPTEMPKKRSGLVVVLLAIIIFLGGIVSVLSFMNISMFRQMLQNDKKEDALAVVVRDDSIDSSVLEVTYGEEIIAIEFSPQSMDYYPQEGGLSLQDIYEQTIQSMVTVETGGVDGTGIILSEDGYILTNNYLLNGINKVNVRLATGEKLPAEVVGRDSFSDLAILQIEAENLIPATFGDSTVLRVGDVVVAISSASGTGVMNDGIISGINMGLRAGGSEMNMLQTNATVDQEQIGGMLINCHGQIIGVHSNCAAYVIGQNGVGSDHYSLDSVTVKNIVEQLINHGFVEGRVHMGIHGQEIDEFYQQYYDIPRGIFITALDEDSNLFARGVREGDILISLADKPVLSFDSLHSLLENLEYGQEVTAVIYRDGMQHQIKVTIGDEP